MKSVFMVLALSIELGERPWYLYFQHYYRGGGAEPEKTHTD